MDILLHARWIALVCLVHFGLDLLSLPIMMVLQIECWSGSMVAQGLPIVQIQWHCWFWASAVHAPVACPNSVMCAWAQALCVCFLSNYDL